MLVHNPIHHDISISPKQHYNTTDWLQHSSNFVPYSTTVNSNDRYCYSAPLVQFSQACASLYLQEFQPFSNDPMQSLHAETQDETSRSHGTVDDAEKFATQDSGLGITTQEDLDRRDSSIRDRLYPHSGTPLTIVSSDQLAAKSEGMTPYTHLVNTDVSPWMTPRAGTTYGDTYPSTYANSPYQQFLSPPSAYTPQQYMVATPEFLHPDGGYGQADYHNFKRPIPRHYSGSSIPSSGSYHTPILGTPPVQWTPQTTTSDWQGNFPHVLHETQTSNTANNYMGYHDIQVSSSSQQHVPTVMTIPPRKKPHLRPSLSESYVPRVSSPARMRAVSNGQYLQTSPHIRSVSTVPQLPLPSLPPSMLIKAPYIPTQHNLMPVAPSRLSSRSRTSTPGQQRSPSSPPASDFVKSNVPYLVPIKQDPIFDGDEYTPRYKRRTSTGRWEGWCGYCQPGRWLDLKNSRYWEDKLRNHGICAKSKMRFDEPAEIRWVNVDGSSNSGEGHYGDVFPDQRRREGFCQVCKKWIVMDGLRTKARGRAVGWWMHAYKCHDHERAINQHTQVS